MDSSGGSASYVHVLLMSSERHNEVNIRTSTHAGSHMGQMLFVMAGLNCHSMRALRGSLYLILSSSIEHQRLAQAACSPQKLYLCFFAIPGRLNGAAFTSGGPQQLERCASVNSGQCRLMSGRPHMQEPSGSPQDEENGGARSASGWAEEEAALGRMAEGGCPQGTMVDVVATSGRPRHARQLLQLARRTGGVVACCSASCEGCACLPMPMPMLLIVELHMCDP